MRRFRPLSAAVIAAALAALAPAPALGQEAPPPISVVDGRTQPVYSYAGAVREAVSIQAPMDSDGDGEDDLIHAHVIRPAETEQGLQVPTIAEVSPYYAGINDIDFYDVDVELTPARRGRGRDAQPPPPPAGQRALTGPKPGPHDPQAFPGFYDNYFVPRGYAVVLAEGPGSGDSEGCPTSGAENETTATTAVVDWLNGRLPAFDAEGEEVVADWSTGSVGMIGASYNGTLPNAAATTGVDGLETIVPTVAISSWYDYYRANGLVVAPGGYQGEDTDVLAEAVLTREDPEICRDVIDAITRDQDRMTGDYNAFWEERDYLRDVGGVEASVFVVDALNDWNVKPKQWAQWWEALGEEGVQRKLWLHQGGHASPFSIRRAEYLDTLNRWFGHELHGIDNGVMDEPAVTIERSKGEWLEYETWPDAAAEDTRLALAPGAGAAPGTLTADRPDVRATETIVDDASITAEDLAADPAAGSPHRLAYLSPPLTGPVRLSGTPVVDLRVAFDRPAANVTALLVDYGTAERVDYDAGFRSTGVLDCYGQGIPGDTGCSFLAEHRTATRPFEVVTRGWTDPQNRVSDASSLPVRPGTTYRLAFDLQPEDYVFAPGHRIGVVLLSSDNEYTQRPAPGTTLTVTPWRSAITLPLVGELPAG